MNTKEIIPIAEEKRYEYAEAWLSNEEMKLKEIPVRSDAKAHAYMLTSKLLLAHLEKKRQNQ